MRKRFLISIVALALHAAAGAASPAPDATPETLLKNGRVDEALTVLNQRAANSQDAYTYHMIARSYFALGKWDEAIKYSQKAIAIAPGTSLYHLYLGRAYGRKAENVGFLTAASLAGKMRDEFEKAVALNGDDVSARTDLAEFYIEAPALVGGGKDKARRQADTIAAKDGATAHWIRARVAEKEKDYNAAEEEYRAAIAESGNRPDNWLSLASFYRRRGRLHEMEAAINKAISAQKKPSNILYDAATLLFRSGRSLPEAAQYLTKYLSAKDKVEDAPAFQAYYLLGQVLEKQGDREGARKQYEAALALAHDYAEARQALARLQ